jgi:hypothetical protein
MKWWQATFTTLLGVGTGFLLTYWQSRAERKRAQRARWSEIGAPALAKVRRFLAEANPEIVTAGIEARDEEKAQELRERLLELRGNYLEPLLMLIDQHPEEEVRQLADRIAGDATRVMNRVFSQIGAAVHDRHLDPSREAKAEELHAATMSDVEELARLLRGERRKSA